MMKRDPRLFLPYASLDFSSAVPARLFQPNTYQDFLIRVQFNPKDAEAWRCLWVCYDRGWGVPRNPDHALSCLKRAAQEGSQDAQLELQRQQADWLAQLEQIQLTQSRFIKARDFFVGKIGLIFQIFSEVFPALVSIRMRNGRRGMGFFQHPEWLVSNAHVFPDNALLAIAQLLDFGAGTRWPLTVENSYHRPHDFQAPDVVVVNTRARCGERFPCLPTESLGFTEDDAYPASVFFYVDQGRRIHWLYRLTPEDFYPQVYQSEDGTEPQPGSSGTPIIEARVVMSRAPIWQMRVVGVLYARCSPRWYNFYFSHQYPPVSEMMKLVCAIPVEQEFGQILAMLQAEKSAQRYRQMASMGRLFSDRQGRENVQRWARGAREAEARKSRELAKFQAGISDLSIALPEGLEPLIGGGIQRLENSMLLKKNFTKLPDGRERPELAKNPPTLEELRRDFDTILRQISRKEFSVRDMNKDEVVLTEHFRLDTQPTGSGWKLEIQDNVKSKCRKVTLSGTYGIVIVEKDYPFPLQGNVLEPLFRQIKEEGEDPEKELTAKELSKPKNVQERLEAGKKGKGVQWKP